VRCLEAHALEAASGVFLPASPALAAVAAAAAAAAASSSSPDGAAAGSPPTLAADAARVQAEIEAREAALVHSLLGLTNRLPPPTAATTTTTTTSTTTTATTTVLDVACGAAALSRAAGLRSAFRALQALKRSPQLLEVPERELARRALALKLALPCADVGALVAMRPSLLLLGPAAAVSRVVGAAERQVSALMPGIPWQRKLAEGGTVYWSFSSVLDGSGAAERARVVAAAAEVEEEEEEQQEQQDETRGRR